jgi:hypothetical protein
MICPTILANVGTPLMWLGALQLWGGNLLIAALEAWIIRRWFKPNAKGGVFWIMVLANYFSMLCGMFLLFLLGGFVLEELSGENAIYILPTMVVVMFGVAYFLTLILEWPFCFWAVGKRPNRFRDSLKADLAAQTTSYLMLLPLVLYASTYSLVTSVTPDRSLVSRAPDNATIYYLSPDDKSLWKVRLNGTKPEKIRADIENLRGFFDPARLCLTQQADMSSWDLCIGSPEGKVLVKKVAEKGALVWRDPRTGQIMYAKSASFSEAAILSSSTNAWDVRTTVLSGFSAFNRKTGERIGLALDTPFATWRSFSPSLLPGDLVVFELHGQIVLLDLNNKKIGLIAMGHDPVVVMDENAVPRIATQPASVQTSQKTTTPHE